MKPWSEVAASSGFKSLTPDQQDGARRQYFDDVVAPQVPDSERDEVWGQFSTDAGMGRRELPADVTPSSAGGGRGSVNPTMLRTDAGPSRAQRIAEMDEETDPLNPNYLPITRNAQQAIQTDARGGMDAKRTKAPGRVMDQDIPNASLQSIAQDAASGVLQIIPTVAKGVGDITRMATGDRLGKGLSDYAESSMDAARNLVGSDRAAAQKRRFEQDMTDPALNPADVIVGNPGALADQVLPTVGSMALPVAVAAAAGKLATVSKAAQLARVIDEATILARANKVREAAAIGATVVQNAADTYSTIRDKGGEQDAAYLGAAITAPATYVAGRLTGGGAEGQAAKLLAGQRGAMSAIPGAMLKEGAQEVGEEAGQYAGETVGTGGEFDVNTAGKRLAVAGALGAVMGGGVEAAGAASTMRQDRIKRLRDAGETAVADLLQQKHDRTTAEESADGELQRMPGNPDFQSNYREMRTAGVKPAEAAARSAVTTAYQGLSASAGIPEAITAAALEQAATLPLDQVPGFFANLTDDLAKRGVVQPFEGMADMASGLEAARDDAIEAAMGAAYQPGGEVVQTMDDVMALEKAQAALSASPIHHTVSTADDIVRELAEAAGVPLETVLPTPAPVPMNSAQAAINSVADSVPNAAAFNDQDEAHALQPADELLQAPTHIETPAVTPPAPRPSQELALPVAAPQKARTEKEARARREEIKLNQVQAIAPIEQNAINSVAQTKEHDRGTQAPETIQTEAQGPAAPTAAEQVTPPRTEKESQKRRQAAQAASTDAPITTSNPDGTLNIKGDPAAIKAQLAEAGLTGIPMKGGMQVGKRQAAKAQSVFEPKAPIAQAEPAQAAIKSAAPTGPAHLGRNNQPLTQGGKPYKTRLAAADAKMLQPMMRVVAVNGGFALADKTEKQLAAEAKAARRLRNPQTSPAGEPIPAHAFIAAEGGLHADTKSDMNVGANPKVGNRSLFAGKGKGLSMERATSRLIEEGYLGEGASQNEAAALIKRSLSQPQYNSDGIERIAEADELARYAAYELEQENAIAEVESLDDNEVAYLDDSDIPFGKMPSNTSHEAAMRAMGFTEQEIQDEATANRSRVAQADSEGGSRPGEAAASDAQAGDGQRTPAQGQDEGGLTAPSQRDSNITRTWFDGVEERKVLGKTADGRYIVSGKRMAADDETGSSFGYTHLPNTVKTADELEQLIKQEQGAQSGFALERPTKAAIAERDGRIQRADQLDAKAQIDREAKDQTLTRQAVPEQRRDNSGDMFAMEKAQAEIDQRNTGRAAKADPNQGGMFDEPAPAADQTDTPAFKAWFKGSKVVDDAGNPLPMYHGTSASEKGEAFTSFDTYASSYGLMGMGGYFTADAAVASSYTTKGKGTTPTVYKAFLAIKNPLDMDAKADAAAWKKQFDGAEAYHEGGTTNESWYRAAEASLSDQGLPMYEGAEIMQDGLRAMGFDGITHIGGGRVKSDGVKHRVYIAFEPEQAKSATGNNGNFDKADPRMAFARSEQTETSAFKAWYGDWQNAANGKPNTPGRAEGIAGQPAGRTGDDGGRVAAVNTLQRSGGMGVYPGGRTTVGKVTLPGTAGPVDASGKPVVFYHGTRDDFNAFRTDHPNRKDKGWLGRGVYLTSDESQADDYTWSKRGGVGRNIMPLYAAVKNPYIANIEIKDRLKNASQDKIDAFTQGLVNQGHDGVILENEDGNVELVAFEPVQVKSAIANKGTFDAGNPDITLARDRKTEPASGAKVAEIQKAVDELSAKWQSGPAVQVVRTPADLPVRAPSDARGLIHKGTAYIVASNNPTRNDVARTLAHEAIGHHGLWAILGEDGSKRFSRNLSLALKSGNVPLNKIAAKVRRLYVDEKGKYNLTPEQERDEISAFAAEDAVDPKTGEFKPGYDFVKEVYSKLAAWLRDTMGIKVPFTLAELQGMLVASMRGLEAGKRLSGGGQSVAFSFAGERAITADTHALATARQRLDAGEDADMVRKATGWSQGADDKMRFEISDKDALLKAELDGPNKHKTIGRLFSGEDYQTLGSVLHHPALFAAYPALESLPIKFVSSIVNAGMKGAFGTDGISINSDMSPADALSTMLHEIQHGIQEVEGFAKGGNPESIRDTLQAIAEQKRGYADFAKQKLDDASDLEKAAGYLEIIRQLSNNPAGITKTMLWYEYKPAFVPKSGKERAQVISDTAEKAAQSLRSEIQSGNAANYMRSNGYATEPKELRRLARQIIKELPQGNKDDLAIVRKLDAALDKYSSHDLYRRLAGEVEARNTQTRAGMTDAERRATSPGDTADVKADDVIVTFNGKEMHNAPMPENSREIDEDTGLPLNSDGTVTVYHHTSKAAAASIKTTGRLKAQAEPDVYVTTWRDTDTGYGDTAVAIRVKPDQLVIDDEFPDGRKDFRLNVGRPGGSIKVKVENESTAFARGVPLPGPGLFHPTIWDTPDPTRTDRIIYELQDGKVDLKRVQESIAKSGQQIAEKFDARLAETIYPGRVAYRSQTFLETEAKPLLEAMTRQKVGMNELADYLHARGAQERNKQIAKVNPGMPDGGAGTNSEGTLLTNQAARDYLANIRPDRKSVLDAMAKRVDAITAGTRKLLVTEGLERQETIDAWEGAYKNYIPMFRDEAESAMPPHPQGSGFSVTGSASKRATGSTKEVTNILAHVLMQREAVITRAEKNRVALALYGQALSHPNPDFWTTIKPSMSAAQIGAELVAMGVDPMTAQAGMEGVPTIRTVDPITNKVVDRANPMYQKMPGAIPLKVNGEDRVLMLNVKSDRGLRLAESLKNLDGLTKLDLAGSIVGKSTRWLAAVNTQYNPAFGLVNLTRDTLGGSINLGSTELRGNALKVLAQTPGAILGIARELADGGQTGKWQTLYRQFQADGGQTGFRENFRDPHDRARAIEKELASLGRGKLSPARAAHAMLDLLDGFNTTLENAVRLSAYSEALDKGISRANAARLGRELTVDFNRKGRMGREVGPLYAFFNASVQGSARTVEALKGPTGWKIIAGGLGLGVLQAFMLAAAGYEDDEIPEFVKTRALIIPMFGKEKTYISIPYPLGVHVIPNTGRVLTELVLNGGKDIGKRSVEAIGEIAGAFNPLGGGNILTPDGALKTVAPTLIDPLIEVGFNRNFAGGRIEKEGYGGESDNRPGVARTKESTQRTTTGQVYMGISQAINTLTGGTDYEKGAASPTPERVRYLAQTVGGGVLREIEKTVNASTATARGEKVKMSQIPVAGRFYGEVNDDQVQMSRYYDSTAKLKSLESSFRAMVKAGDAEAARKFMDEHPEIAMARTAAAVQQNVAALNKLAVQTIKNPAMMKQIDEARVENMTALNEVLKAQEAASARVTLGQKLRGAIKPE